MYPAIFLLPRPERSSRLILIFRPVLAIPHGIWAMLNGFFACFVQFLSFWAILFSGRHPRVLWNRLDAWFRYSTRLNAWTMLLADAYPPFSGSAAKKHPVGVCVDFPARISRATMFFRPLIVMPHFFFLIGFTFVIGFVLFAGWWTILFAGRLAEWQRRQMESYLIYVSRLGAYLMYLIDEYPPFNGLQPRAAAEAFAEA